MACLHPITIRNPRYRKLGKEGSREFVRKHARDDPRLQIYKGKVLISEWYDEDKYHYVYDYIIPDEYIQVPCGKCANCIKNKRQQWSIRLLIETRNYEQCCFITLTIAPKYYKKVFSDPKKYLKLYIDRLRKRIGYRPKYFIIPEIGTDQNYSNRLHFHGIIFDTPQSKIPYKVIRDSWQYGIADTGYCNDKTCNYVVKYILKDYEKEFGIKFKPFIMCSNGIGKSYLDNPSLKEWHINGFDFRDYIVFGNCRYPLPVYYRDKLYDEDVKFYKMLNRVFDETPFEKVFNGITYRDLRSYRSAVDSFYNWTLLHDLSKPLTPIKDIVGNLRNVDYRDINSFTEKFLKQGNLF